MWDNIREHEDWQKAPFPHFLALEALKHGTAPLPSEAKGRVNSEVNHGRWIVKCPIVGCGGALIVSSIYPIFFCVECGNEANGGKLYNVQFPPNKKAIEEALLRRPLVARLPSTRHWIPGETVGDLIKENRARGID